MFRMLKLKSVFEDDTKDMEDLKCILVFTKTCKSGMFMVLYWSLAYMANLFVDGAR